ncbi:7115_t:CDS:2, partial [Funneliformis mosseae]
QRNRLSIVKESATSIESPSTIADLFLAATSFYELPPANIQVCFQIHAYHIRFSLNDSIISLLPDKNIPNALETLIQNSKKLQLLPAKRKDFVKRLTNLIWYIDSYWHKFTRRSFYMPLFVQQLPEYQKDRVYNLYYEESHHKKEEINSVQKSIVQPWALKSKWESFQIEVIQLCEACQNYIRYLEIDHIKVEDLPICEDIKPKYQPIINILNTVREFEPICIDEYLPVNSLKRPVFLKEMSLSSPMTLYIYYYGNYL